MSNHANGEPSPKTSGSPIEALRAARTRLQEDRDNFAEYHRWGNGEFVSDSAAAEVAKYDAVLAQIDAALAEFDASLTDPADTRSDQTPQPEPVAVPTRQIAVVIDVPADWERSLAMQWHIEAEIKADRWAWHWWNPPRSYERMTTQEIEDVYAAVGRNSPYLSGVTKQDVARAIERAVLERLGIKEETK